MTDLRLFDVPQAPPPPPPPSPESMSVADILAELRLASLTAREWELLDQVEERAIYALRPPADRPRARAADPATSHMSAQDTPTRKTQRGRLLRAFLSTRPAGLTAEEAAAAIGEPSAWRRVSELLAAGWLRETGYTRSTSSGRPGRVLNITPDAVERLTQQEQPHATPTDQP